MEYKCKTAILIIFFNRPNCLREVLQSVRKVAPSVLYLAQDGCRNDSDRDNVLACQRLIDEYIDWPCEIKTRFSEVNLGCEENEYSGLKWVFENEERIIVLEDDVVPSISFYRFCDELLEKYKDDQRINAINGFLNVEYASPYSYVFCNIGASYGWATWRRCFNQWDPSLSICDNPHEYELLKQTYDLDYVMKPIWRNRIIEQHRTYDGKCQGWESLYYLSRVCYSQHCICSTKNLIKNVGIGSDALHGGSDNLPKKTIDLLMREGEELDFPLKHPPFIIHDYKLDIQSSKIAYNYKWWTMWKRYVPEGVKKIYRASIKKMMVELKHHMAKNI